MVNRDLELLENESIYRAVVNGGKHGGHYTPTPTPIMADYLILSQSGGVADHAHHITTALPHSPRLSDLPTALM